MPHGQGWGASLGIALLIQERAQTRVPRAAHRVLRPIRQDGEMALLAVGLYFYNTLQVHDIGPMDAHEAGGIEARLQAGDGLLLQMFLTLRG